MLSILVRLWKSTFPVRWLLIEKINFSQIVQSESSARRYGRHAKPAAKAEGELRQARKSGLNLYCKGVLYSFLFASSRRLRLPSLMTNSSRPPYALRLSFTNRAFWRAALKRREAPKKKPKVSHRLAVDARATPVKIEIYFLWAIQIQINNQLN